MMEMNIDNIVENKEAAKVSWWINKLGLNPEFSDDMRYIIDADVNEIHIVCTRDYENTLLPAPFVWYYIFNCTANGKQEIFKCKNIYLKNIDA